MPCVSAIARAPNTRCCRRQCKAGLRQHTRRRSNTPRRAARALGAVNNQVRQLLCPQLLERPNVLNNTIQDLLLPLVDGLACPCVAGHPPQKVSQGQWLRPFQSVEDELQLSNRWCGRRVFPKKPTSRRVCVASVAEGPDNFLRPPANTQTRSPVPRKPRAPSGSALCARRCASAGRRRSRR